MNEKVLNKIGLITRENTNSFKQTLVTFNNATITLSGDYMIITEIKNDDSTISTVMNLANIHSYKIYNNNEEN